MKKSLEDARLRAVEYSRTAKGVLVRVMDKPRKRAVVNSSGWAYRELVLAGYATVAVFKDGKEVFPNELPKATRQ